MKMEVDEDLVINWCTFSFAKGAKSIMVFKITSRLKGGESTVEAETDPIYFSTSGGIMIILILTI